MRRGTPKTSLQKVTDVPWVEVGFGSCVNRALAVEEEILEKCKRASYSEDDLFAIKLALEEALVNACKHGNKLDRDKQVKVQYRVTPQRLDVAVEDEGPGFKPSELQDPTVPENLERCGGRGVLLMRWCMNNVVYNSRGNRVTLTKFKNGEGLPPSQSNAAMG